MWLFVLWCLALTSSCSGEDPPEVQTLSGQVRGVTVDGIRGKSVDVFLGIPYGAPTGGQNRFSPPKEAAPWEGVLDASRFSKPCHQVLPKHLKNLWWATANEESEDCLTVNVWVPKPRPKAAAVMVWIHGGGFTAGSSDAPAYNGAVLAAREDVVVVSLNYRLSAFGFLYLDHPLAPGNVGLMDQTLGLQWVKRNVDKFGGDPNRVTLFGQSAGAASASVHLLSPTSMDLFQNVILQSGTLNAPWALSEPETALARGLQLAERAGCPVQQDKREETIKCLQQISGEALSEHALAVEGALVKFIFRPVIDGIYLSASPYELLSKGRFCSGKNVLIGYTKDDGSFVIPLWSPNLMRPDMNSLEEKELRQMVSQLTYMDSNVSGFPLELLSHLYSEWNSNTNNYTLTFDGLIRYSTDRWFGCPTTTAVDKVAENGNSVFFYFFNHLSQTDPPVPSWMGVQHGSDVAFSFGHHLLNTNAKQEDVKMAEQIMRYLANFAKTGDPNDDSLPLWSKYTNQNKQYLQIDGKATTMGMVQRMKECAFWEHVFPKMEVN